MALPSTQKDLVGLARALERVLGFPEGRLSCVGDWDSGIPGKALLMVTGNPTLDSEEVKKVEQVVKTLNASMGGEPPIPQGDA